MQGHGRRAQGDRCRHWVEDVATRSCRCVGRRDAYGHCRVRRRNVQRGHPVRENSYDSCVDDRCWSGHEFGHIVEALAQHEIPHGECVAIGMAISSFLAHLKGTLWRSDLERILNCILDLGLPIYMTDYDCCNANVLWVKISTDGIGHK